MPPENSSPLCGDCSHPFGWHGDRAIAACDGGFTDLSFTRRRTQGLYEPVSLCACSGWKQP